MSKEQDFYKLIEEQPSNEKARVWTKISNKLNEETTVEVAVLPKKRFWTVRKIISVCSSIIVFAIIGIGLSIGLSPKNEDARRYCRQGDYYTIDSEYTLKEYSQINNNEILYFSWWEESEYYYDFEYRLYSTDEIVCFAEDIYDLNDVFITLYVTDNRTEIDFLDFSNSCSYTANVNDIEITYGIGAMESRGYFSYYGYNYYLTTDCEDSSYFISLCEQLFNK